MRVFPAGEVDPLVIRTDDRTGGWVSPHQRVNRVLQARPYPGGERIVGTVLDTCRREGIMFVHDWWVCDVNGIVPSGALLLDDWAALARCTY